MIDIDRLRQLVDLMVEHDLTEVDVSDEDQSITIKRGTAASALANLSNLANLSGPAPAQAAPAPAQAPAAGPADTGARSGRAPRPTRGWWPSSRRWSGRSTRHRTPTRRRSPPSVRRSHPTRWCAWWRR
ncbi:MAG: hypothetical protein KatS3mg103_1235 [Phycisphaerales bacterium]|nr:MAG: hypothetical protein KatS3mg103_1235 [Phycisphaerales bacterium]